MKRITLFFALSVSLFSGSEDDKIILDPFSDNQTNEAYQPIEWPNLDFPLFMAGVAAHWEKHGRWPQTIAEVKNGSRLWAATLKLEDKEKVDAEKYLERVDAFEITEIISMWRGVSYRLVYKKKSRSIPGMIVFDQADTTEKIMKSARFSEDFGGITHAVPF